MKVAHLVLPHPETHKSAYLLRWQAILAYIILFLALQLNLKYLTKINPQILGTSSSITIQEVISDTNTQRAKFGLPPLKENQQLDAAAEAKASNMFEENYWAHFSPSGKDPWGFIKSAGYKFSYAGENLARNFTNSEDVVIAWMNSPSHRENLLNSHYQDIGIAVEDGTLVGEKTTLVVQMFGTPVTLPSSILVSPNQPSAQTVQVDNQALVQSQLNSPSQGQVLPVMIDSFTIYKSLGLILVGGISTLLFVEYLVLRKRGVFRLKSHHFAHVSLLSLTAAGIITTPMGQISQMAASIIVK